MEEKVSTIPSTCTSHASRGSPGIHEQPRPNIVDTRFISPHSSRIIPKTNPYPTTYTPAYPSSRTPVPLSLLARGSRAAWVSPEGEIDASGVCSLHSCCCYSIPKGFERGGSFSFFLLSFFLGGRMEWRGDVDSSGKETRRKRKGARLTSVLVMAWRIGRDWIEPTRNTSGLNERGWATETAEVGQRETASAALGVGVGWLSGARVVG